MANQNNKRTIDDHALALAEGVLVKLRCGARTRRGTPCNRMALRNGRCAWHGGKSTGRRRRHSADD